jgi:hypothetical protein
VCPAAAANRDHEGKQEAASLKVAFGSGLFRCPGRYLALMQVSLTVAVFFACTDACLCSTVSSDHTDRMSGVQECSEAPHDRKSVQRWLRPEVVPGEHIVARGVRSGDPDGPLLPCFDSRQLVGVKKPVEPLLAVCRSLLHGKE